VRSARVYRLGDLQLRVMQVLWGRPEATVSEVHQSLGQDLAYTTVATLLRRLETRGLVKHRQDGRSFIYRAAVAAEDVTRGAAEHLLEGLFEGSLSDMVSHLLKQRDVSRRELAEIERLIAERKKEL
jgi:predicted transcriptional regulator